MRSSRSWYREIAGVVIAAQGIHSPPRSWYKTALAGRPASFGPRPNHVVAPGSVGRRSTSPMRQGSFFDQTRARTSPPGEVHAGVSRSASSCASPSETVVPPAATQMASSSLHGMMRRIDAWKLATPPGRREPEERPRMSPARERRDRRAERSAPARRAEALVGRLLCHKWRVDRLLNCGGTSWVYSAAHRNGMRVAVKVLRPELAADARARRRFLREGYLANRVGHPGVVRALDDDVDDGVVFLVMELLHGATLERLAAER